MALCSPLLLLMTLVPAVPRPLAAAGGDGARTTVLPGAAAPRAAALTALFPVCPLALGPRGAPGTPSRHPALKHGGCILCINFHKETEHCQLLEFRQVFKDACNGPGALSIENPGMNSLLRV